MENNKNEKCSERISKALSIRNIKQTELCEKTKIPKSALSQYITGAFEPKQDRLMLIAQALDVDPVWLMGFDVPMEKQEKGSSDDKNLTEGKRLMLELLDEIPEEEQILLAKSIRAFRQIPAEHQKILNQIIRAALNNQI